LAIVGVANQRRRRAGVARSTGKHAARAVRGGSAGKRVAGGHRGSAAILEYTGAAIDVVTGGADAGVARAGSRNVRAVAFDISAVRTRASVAITACGIDASSVGIRVPNIAITRISRLGLDGIHTVTVTAGVVNATIHILASRLR